MKKRIPLKDRVLPAYTSGEERFHMISHIVGGGLAVVMTVIALIVSIRHGNPWAIVGSSIYGGTLIIMFTVSSIYHGLHIGIGKKVMQVIDHCDIYFLIAGTYTPIMLAGIRVEHPVIAWSVFSAEWALTALAVTLTAIDLKKYAFFSMLCYLGMGWFIVLALRTTVECLTPAGFGWLLTGGIAYTVGAVLYNLGKRRIRYMHAVFHVFVVLGSVLQFWTIVRYVL